MSETIIYLCRYPGKVIVIGFKPILHNSPNFLGLWPITNALDMTQTVELEFSVFDFSVGNNQVALFKLSTPIQVEIPSEQTFDDQIDAVQEEISQKLGLSEGTCYFSYAQTDRTHLQLFTSDSFDLTPAIDLPIVDPNKWNCYEHMWGEHLEQSLILGKLSTFSTPELSYMSIIHNAALDREEKFVSYSREQALHERYAMIRQTFATQFIHQQKQIEATESILETLTAEDIDSFFKSTSENLPDESSLLVEASPTFSNTLPSLDSDVELPDYESDDGL